MNEEEINELIFLWQEYGKEKDENLTKDSIKLKRDLITFVKNLPKFTFVYRSGNFSKHKEMKK